MKIFQSVRSTAKNVPSIEVNVDTVYVRSDIERVEEMEFSGWEYDEIQYKKDNYIELISKSTEILKLDINDVADMTVLNAMDKDDLAEMVIYCLSKIDELEVLINDKSMGV